MDELLHQGGIQMALKRQAIEKLEGFVGGLREGAGGGEEGGIGGGFPGGEIGDEIQQQLAKVGIELTIENFIEHTSLFVRSGDEEP